MRWVTSSLPIALAAVALSAFGAAEPPDAPKSFVLCYNPKASVSQLKAYDLIVVDYAYPPPAIAELRKQKKTVLGYLSLGKVQKGRPFLKEIQRQKIKLTQDPIYPDSFRVDVADPKWLQFVAGLVKQMEKTGFGGVFLDDLDDIAVRKEQQRAVALIAGIRAASPKMTLMANRGLEFLPDFAKDIDYALLETCFAQDGAFRPAADPAWAMGRLTAGQAANPKLVGCALDYFAGKWPAAVSAAQQKLIADLRKLHEERGLLSCVSTEDLQTVPPPTKAPAK